jgi:hypothetical protein
MSYRYRIQALQEMIKQLDEQITDANCTATKLLELKDRKSEYEAEIRRLNRLQWEEDTQRVNLDDDR